MYQLSSDYKLQRLKKLLNSIPYDSQEITSLKEKIKELEINQAWREHNRKKRYFPSSKGKYSLTED